MLVQLDQPSWKVLRHVAREGRVAGRDLRILPTRKTKDGTFLDDLIAKGLLALDGNAPKDSQNPDEPIQFTKMYVLTEMGEYAAEYGEYEYSYTPNRDAPLTGTAAELWKTLERTTESGEEKTKGRKRTWRNV